MTLAEADHYRALLEQFLRSVPAFPEGRFQDRGIVLCGGGKYYFPCVWVCIRLLRALGCSLPIELWHRGPREMTDEMRALVEPLGVVCRDAYNVMRDHPVHRLDGWELKPFAIMHSRFAEVLFIDADNVAVRDPEFLFTEESYLTTGALFWPDLFDNELVQARLRDEAWELLGVPFQREAEFETGQMVIDKRRCWQALQLTMHLNSHSDYYYRFFAGDKDTFHLAWRRLEQEYGLIAHPPVPLSEREVLIQLDPAGARLFQHRCNVKWSLTRRNKRIRGFLYEETCLAYLRELQASWPAGSTADEPARNALEWRAADDIIRQGSFDGYAAGRDVRPCSFLADGTAELDELPYEWRVEEDKEGEAVLILSAEGKRLCFLRRTPEGNWSGLWLYGDRPAFELRPAPTAVV